MTPDWRDLFNYGLPTVLLAGVAAATWKVLVWLRDNVVQPMVAAHVSTVAVLREQLPAQTSELRKQTELLKKVREELSTACKSPPKP